MYVESELITPDDATVVWRYMDLDKFLFLIRTRSLWFATPSTLKDDPWEGIKPSLHRDPDFIASTIDMTNWPIHAREGYIATTIKVAERTDLRDLWGVNCWHMNVTESQAFWSRFPEGVAIRTTVGSLKKSLKFTKDDVRIGTIQYRNEDNFYINSNFSIYEIMWKREYYTYENELRLVTGISVNTPVEIKVKGLTVGVDLDALIQTVYAAPESTPAFIENLRAQLQENGLEKDVSISALSRKPF